MDILLCKPIFICSLVILCYLFMSLEVIPQKKCCPTHIFPFFAVTPCLTNAVKRPDNLNFQKKNSAVMTAEEKY